LALSDLWIAATHAHSSSGAHDDRLVAEVAGTGRFREDVREAWVEAIARAVEQAHGGLGPASLELASDSAPELVSSRVRGLTADPRIDRVVFRRPDGAIAAQWIVLAAHPTLHPREAVTLSPDYPGHLARAMEGVVLVLQGSGGNAMAAFGETVPAVEERAKEYSRRVRAALQRRTLAPVASPRLRVTRVDVTLPRADGSRLVGPLFENAVENAMCASSAERLPLARWELGPFKWVSAPGELTSRSGEQLERAADATRAVTLVNGYVGYVEPRDVVVAGEGESRRQYYEPDLLERLVSGATLLR
jgi:neutral ceramidase